MLHSLRIWYIFEDVYLGSVWLVVVHPLPNLREPLVRLTDHVDARKVLKAEDTETAVLSSAILFCQSFMKWVT